MSFNKFISNLRAGVAKRFDLKTDAEIDAFFIGLEESAHYQTTASITYQ